MSVLDVFILNFEYDTTGKLQNIVSDFTNSIIHDVFGRNDIPWNCTQQEMDLLKNNILNLPITKQIYVLQHLLDCEYSLSLDVQDFEYQKTLKVEKILVNFPHYKPFLNGSLTKEIIPELEEQFKIKIFYSSDDYDIKKIRKEKLLKITEANDDTPKRDFTTEERGLIEDMNGIFKKKHYEKI